MNRVIRVLDDIKTRVAQVNPELGNKINDAVFDMGMNEPMETEDSTIDNGMNPNIQTFAKPRPEVSVVGDDGTVHSFAVEIKAKHNGLICSLFGSATDKINGISISGFFSVHKIINGLSVSAIGINYYKINGVSIAIINKGILTKGLQLGVYNSSVELRGIQFGLWNKNKKRSFPIINW